jgi:ribosomal protein L37AE/L43A
MSKGSVRRPTKIDPEIVRSNWDKIFGKVEFLFVDKDDEVLECPQCKNIELRPTENGMWGCDHCFIEIQF